MADNSNEKIYFAVDYVFSIVAEILEKNGFKVSLDDDVENTDSKKNSFIDIVFSLTNDLALGKIPEKYFVSSLQKQLNAPKKAAEGILKGVKEKLLPFAEKVKIGDDNIAEAPEKQIDPTKTARPARLIDRDKDIIKKPTEPKTEEIEEQLPKTVLPQERPKSSGPDNYREPIE